MTQPWDDPTVLSEFGCLAKAAHQGDPPANMLANLAKVRPQRLAELVLAAAALVDPNVPLRRAIEMLPRLPMCTKNLHLMTDDNISWQRNGKGQAKAKRCRACDRERQRQRREYLAAARELRMQAARERAERMKQAA